MIKYTDPEHYKNFAIGVIYYNSTHISASYIYRVSETLAYQLILYNYGGYYIYIMSDDINQADYIFELDDAERVKSDYFAEVFMENFL